MCVRCWCRTLQAGPRAFLLACWPIFPCAHLRCSDTSVRALNVSRSNPTTPLKERAFTCCSVITPFLPAAGWSADRSKMSAFTGRWPQGFMTLQITIIARCICCVLVQGQGVRSITVFAVSQRTGNQLCNSEGVVPHLPTNCSPISVQACFVMSRKKWQVL